MKVLIYLHQRRMRRRLCERVLRAFGFSRRKACGLSIYIP